MRVYTALLVGFGQAGRRIFEAAQLTTSEYGRIEITSIVDRRSEAFASHHDSKIALYTSMEEALKNRFDCVFVCVNDIEHYAVLSRLNSIVGFRPVVICEKPLTQTLIEAQDLAKLMRTDVVLNFTERYSPVIAALEEILEAEGLQIARADCFWGKQRVYDTRPSMGVFSELSHPLDLVLYLSKYSKGTAIRCISSTTISSRFPAQKIPRPDTVLSALVIADDLLLTLVSSYTWPVRDRRISLLLKNSENCICKSALLTFDTPAWGDDSIQTFNLDGAARLSFDSSVCGLIDAGHGYPKSIRKTCIFLRTAIRWISSGDITGLAGFDHGEYVQEIIEVLSVACRREVEIFESNARFC